jgi:hypothetical protein
VLLNLFEIYFESNPLAGIGSEQLGHHINAVIRQIDIAGQMQLPLYDKL